MIISMCDRYTLYSPVDELRAHFGVPGDLAYRRRYNVAPTSTSLVYRMGDTGPELVHCKWGLVPGWARVLPANKPITARSETLALRPSFRSAFRHRRCLVPANGYYEWTHGASGKQPYYIRLADAELFAFAGIWERWEHAGTTIDTFAIITTPANTTLMPVHNRMPAILNVDQYQAWLTGGWPELLTPYPGSMRVYPVSARINSPEHEGEDLIARVASPQTEVLPQVRIRAKNLSAQRRQEWIQKAIALPEPARARFFCYLAALLYAEDPEARRYWRLVEDGKITSVEQLVSMYYRNPKRLPLASAEDDKP